MTNKLPVQVEVARFFVRALKRLRKKHPHIVEDVETLIARLEQGETPGNQVPQVKYRVFKVRLRSRDQSKGKSGGYRVIYYVQTADQLILITIYAKSEQEDIGSERIRHLIEQYERERS